MRVQPVQILPGVTGLGRVTMANVIALTSLIYSFF